MKLIIHSRILIALPLTMMLLITAQTIFEFHSLVILLSDHFRYAFEYIPIIIGCFHVWILLYYQQAKSFVFTNILYVIILTTSFLYREATLDSDIESTKPFLIALAFMLLVNYILMCVLSFRLKHSILRVWYVRIQVVTIGTNLLLVASAIAITYLPYWYLSQYRELLHIAVYAVHLLLFLKLPEIPLIEEEEADSNSEDLLSRKDVE